jgi:hypothetical protein
MAKKPPKRRAATTPKTPPDPLRATPERARLADRLQAAVDHLAGLTPNPVAKAAAAIHAVFGGTPPHPGTLEPGIHSDAPGTPRLEEPELEYRDRLHLAWKLFRLGYRKVKPTGALECDARVGSQEHFAAWYADRDEGEGRDAASILRQLRAHIKYLERKGKRSR